MTDHASRYAADLSLKSQQPEPVDAIFESVPAAPRLTVRQAARAHQPLDGADAQALEGALRQVERELEEVKAKAAQTTIAQADEHARIQQQTILISRARGHKIQKLERDVKRLGKELEATKNEMEFEGSLKRIAVLQRDHWHTLCDGLRQQLAKAERDRDEYAAALKTTGVEPFRGRPPGEEEERSIDILKRDLRAGKLDQGEIAFRLDCLLRSIGWLKGTMSRDRRDADQLRAQLAELEQRLRDALAMEHQARKETREAHQQASALRAMLKEIAGGEEPLYSYDPADGPGSFVCPGCAADLRIERGMEPQHMPHRQGCSYVKARALLAKLHQPAAPPSDPSGRESAPPKTSGIPARVPWIQVPGGAYVAGPDGFHCYGCEKTTAPGEPLSTDPRNGALRCQRCVPVSESRPAPAGGEQG